MTERDGEISGIFIPLPPEIISGLGELAITKGELPVVFATECLLLGLTERASYMGIDIIDYLYGELPEQSDSSNGNMPGDPEIPPEV
jgi:hypothetical protein